MSRCSHCPRDGLACRGEEIPRLCELVRADGPAYHPAYRSRLDPSILEAPTSEGNFTAAPMPLDESLRLVALTRRCPYRSKAKCGCDGAAACALRGGADVSASTCWNCVRTHGV
jgi:hypothetical protein